MCLRPFTWIGFTWLGCLAAISGTTYAATEPPPALTLPKALAYALEHSPGYESARLEVEIRERTRKNALASFFPSLDANATQGLKNQLPNNSGDFVYGIAGLTLTETLYDNGQNFWNYKAARLAEERAQVDLEKGRAQLALTLAQAFYDYSKNTRVADLQKQRLEVLSKQFRTVEGQYRQGMRTRRDYLRFKTQVQRAEIILITAENSRQVSRTEMLRLLGAPVEEIGAITETPAFTFVPMPESREAQSMPTEPPSLERHYESRIRAIGQAGNEVPVRQALRNYLPRATVAGSMGWSTGTLTPGTTTGPYQGNQGLTWDVSLGLTYNLWDWGILRREWAKAERVRDQGNLALLGNLQNTAANIRKLMLQLAQLRKNLELSRQLLGYEEESYESVNSEFKLGRVAYLDLITALDSLFSARSSYADAYFTVLGALAEYHYHQGDLYESISKE